MIAQIKQRIKLFVTPRLLRAWADRMEEKWPRMKCGDSVIWNDIAIDETTDLTICFNQDEMDREQNRRKNCKICGGTGIIDHIDIAEECLNCK